MKYLLDTNICIYLIKRRPEAVLTRFHELSLGDIGISVITLYELLFGAYKSQHTTKSIKAVQQLIKPLEVIDFNDVMADVCGRIRAEQERAGRCIGPMDLQIAATALTLNTTLVTNNQREFGQIAELTVETWV